MDGTNVDKQMDDPLNDKQVEINALPETDSSTKTDKPNKTETGKSPIKSLAPSPSEMLHAFQSDNHLSTYSGSLSQTDDGPRCSPTSITDDDIMQEEEVSRARRFTFGRKASAKIGKGWTKAMLTMNAMTEFQKKNEEIDPFLSRFTVTGRSYTEENTPVIYSCTDYFKCSFWATAVGDPSGKFYYVWSFFLMLAIFYNLIFIMLRWIFLDNDYKVVFTGVDIFCDVLYLVDMFVSSRKGFLEQGLLVRDVPLLRRRYLKSWMFPVDVLSNVPTEISYLWIGIKPQVRLNRLCKLWRFRQFFHIAETKSNFPNTLRVVNLLLYCMIVIHWFACFFFGLSWIIGFGSDSWVYPDLNSPDHGDFWHQYTYSFYWATLTLTTIGDTPFPVTPTETAFCVVCDLIGVLIFATIFGNVGAMINHIGAARTQFQNKVDCVRTYMDHRGIKPELQARVIKWFDYTWNNKESVDDRESLRYLPEKLRAELSIHVHMATLRQVALFQDCEPGLLVELVLKLRLQVFSPGDFVCRKGDIGKEMYIIKRGKLQVVSEDGETVFVTLSDGAVFGEVSILNIAGNKTGNRRTASVKTVGYSDVFSLSKHDLRSALEEYPDAKRMLLEKGRQLLRKDKLIDEEAAVTEQRNEHSMEKKMEDVRDTVDQMQKSIFTMHQKMNRVIAMVSEIKSPNPAKR